MVTGLAVLLAGAGAATLCWPSFPARVHPLRAARHTPAHTLSLGRRGFQRPRRRHRRSGRVVRGGAVALGFVGVGMTLSWSWAVAATVAGMTALHLVRRARRGARERATLSAAATVLRLLVRELQAGVGPAEALEHAVREGPAGAASLLVPLHAEMGVSTRGSLLVIPDGSFVSELGRRVAACWRLSVWQGIPLSGVLQALCTDVDDRLRALEQHAAEVAGPSVSGYVLAALPVAGLALGAGMGTDPITVLTGSAVGGVLLVAGVVLCCGGLLWADRIVRGPSDG